MKKLVVILGILVLVLAGLLLIKNFTGKVIFTPTVPTDCSDASIRATWDSIFKESSNGINITSNTSQPGKCNFFSATKTVNNKTFILVGRDLANFFFTNMTLIFGVQGNITNISALNSSGLLTASPSSMNLSGIVGTRNIASSSQADSEFRSVFNAVPSNWQTNVTSNGTFYTFSNNETVGNESRVLAGIVPAGYSIDYIAYERMAVSLLCVQNIIAMNTSCRSDRTLIMWYNDINSCGGVLPNNITFNCSGNSVVGNLSAISTINLNLSVFVDGSQANSSLYYNSSKLVEFREGSISRIKFNHSFNSGQLNVSNVTVTRQPDGYGFGYLLISGLNEDKTVMVDKINGSNLLCIKDGPAPSLSSISLYCEADDEYLLSCPGNNYSFSCAISGNYYQVSGLTNSGIKEVYPPSLAILSLCTPYWECSNFSTCVNGNKTRTCADLNGCNITSGEPELVQSCSNLCAAIWNCSSWQPVNCPENRTRYRTCIDQNNCGILSGKPNETQTCIPASSSLVLSDSIWTYIIWGGVLFIVIVIIAIVIVLVLTRKPKTDSNDSSSGLPPTNPDVPISPSPASYTPQALPEQGDSSQQSQPNAQTGYANLDDKI